MPRIRRIINREGQAEPYRHEKVVASILNAIRSSGAGSEELADQIANMVEFYLDRYYGEGDPSVQDVSHGIEQALRSLEGAIERAADIADAYVENLTRTESLRRLDSAEPLQTKSDNDDSDAAPQIMVRSNSASEAIPFSRSRIEAALIRECKLERVDAANIAQAVEGRIRLSDLRRVTSALVRELVELELGERGLDGGAGRLSAPLSLPAWDLEQAIFPVADLPLEAEISGNEALQSWVATHVLHTYSMGQVYTRDVARAHVSGELILEHSGEPAGAARISLNALALHKQACGIESLEPFFPAEVRDPDDFLLRLGELANASVRLTSGELRLTSIDSALAPFIHGGIDAERLAFALVERLGLAAGEGQTITIVADACAGRIDRPGSTALLRALLNLLGDATLRQRQSVHLCLELGPAAFSDPEAHALVERAATRALTDGHVSFSFARAEKRPKSGGGNLFGEENGDVTAVEACISACSLNLLHPLLTREVENENDYFEALDRAITRAADASSQRAHFFTRFHQRRRERALPLSDTLGRAICEVASADVGFAGLAEASRWLAGGSLAEPSGLLRAAQRLVFYLQARVQEASTTSDLNLELCGKSSLQVEERMLELCKRSDTNILKRIMGEWVGQPSAGLNILASQSAGWQERCETESRLHSAVDRAEFTLYASDRIGTSALLQHLSRAATPRMLPLKALRVLPDLRVCGKCGTLSPADVTICPACSASEWKSTRGQRTLFSPQEGEDSLARPSRGDYTLL